METRIEHLCGRTWLVSSERRSAAIPSDRRATASGSKP